MPRPSAPPRRLSTTIVFPPRLPAKLAWSTDSPKTWVTAMPPPSTAAVLSSERRVVENSRQQSGSEVLADEWGVGVMVFLADTTLFTSS